MCSLEENTVVGASARCSAQRSSPSRGSRLLIQKALLLGAALQVSACSSAEREAQAAVKQSLTDPDSAQFAEVIQKLDYVCGKVNAKNRMGGYIGFRNFYVAERGKGAVVIDPQSWATPATREIFGGILSPSTDTTEFEAIYSKVCA